MSDTSVAVPSLGLALGGGGTVTPITAEHWRRAAEGVYTVPTCGNCGTNRWPVLTVCYVCGSTEWSWQPVPGTGTVYTYTWTDSPTHPDFGVRNIAVIELDGTKGEPVRVPGWVEGVERDRLQCGLAVKMEVEIVAEGVGVTHWVPR
jgi:uncharacterized OB-fold protein